MRYFFTILFVISFAIAGSAQDNVSVSSGNAGLALENRYEGTIITYAPIVDKPDAFSSITYEWSELIDGKSNSIGTEDSLLYTIPMVGTKLGTSIDISVIIKGTPVDSLVLPLDTTIHYVLNVYSQPSVSQSAYDAVLFVGDESTLSFSPVGGKEGSWSYQWDIDGSTSSTYTYKATKSGDYDVKVVVKNSLGNSDSEYDYSETLTYSIKVWDACSVTSGGSSENLNCFEGQTYTYEPIVSGGDSSKWTYEWYVDNQLVSNEKTYTNVAPSVGEEGSVTSTIVLKATNTPENINKPFTKDLTFVFDTWSRGYVTKVDMDRVYYHGQSVSMAVDYFRGYPDGWTFKWVKLMNSELLGRESSCEDDRVVNESTKKQIHTYQIEWSNAIGSNIGSHGIDTINIEVYPKIVPPSFGYTEPIQIRDIDTITIQTMLGERGYPQGWSYIWNDDATATNFSYTISSEIHASTKEIKIDSVTLYWENRGPAGDVWDKGNIVQQILVYNTPKTPVFKMKGNGTSNIYIVDGMDMTESELWDKEYIFKFWDGNTLIAEMKDQRWCKYYDRPNKAWVQSVWYYEDGFVCEGEAALLSTAQYMPTSKSMLRVYRIDGELVMQCHCEEGSSIADVCASLSSGLYVVKMDCAGVCETSKIVIK